MATSKSCAACTFFNRHCKQNCVFASYFPRTEPKRFECVHKVYGADNVEKLLNRIPLHGRRVEAINSLVSDAQARINDPVKGCVARLYSVQTRLMQAESELHATRQKLAACVREQDFAGKLEHNQQQQKQEVQHQQHQMMFNNQFVDAGPSNQHNQQLYAAPQLQLVVQHMLRRAQQHHHQHQQLMSLVSEFNRRFDGAGPSSQATHTRLLPVLNIFMQRLIRLECIIQEQNQPSPKQQELIQFMLEHMPPGRNMIHFIRQLIDQGTWIQLQNQPPLQQHPHPPQQQNQPLQPQPVRGG